MAQFAFPRIPKNAGMSFKSLVENDTRLKDFLQYVVHAAPRECFEAGVKRMIVLRELEERFCPAFYYSYLCCQHAANGQRGRHR